MQMSNTSSVKYREKYQDLSEEEKKSKQRYGRKWYKKLPEDEKKASWV